MATIRDVAQYAGVSVSTVSRVCNGSKAVSDAVSFKVESAIDELDYSCNNLARSLRSTHTNNIAFIVTSLSRPFFTEILEGVNKRADELNYSVMIAETRDSLERESRLVNDFVSQWVDGIILASSAYGSDPAAQKYVNRLGKLQKKGFSIPVVTLEFGLPNSRTDAVIIDHAQGSYKAVTHLIREAHRKNIVHVSLPASHLIGQQREKGYRQALENSGLPVRPEYIVAGNYTIQSGYDAVIHLLEQRIDFDAIFCANDQMALGAMTACKENNLQIPTDVAIIGYDDTFASPFVNPSLSSISVPKRQLGSAAMRLIHERLNEADGDTRQKKITLDTTLIVRDSTIPYGQRPAFQ